jgi:phage tail-like protein
MNAVSEYLQYLPRIFREGAAGEVGEQEGFLGEYLKIFEALLSGRDDAEIETENGPLRITGLEQRVSQFENYLDAGLTPDLAFLTYLAQWVALSFDQNWKPEEKRQWLWKIVPLYKKRGTKSGLIEYLNMFAGKQVEVEEPEGGFIIGEKDNSIVGMNTFVGEPAYFFRVKFNYGYPPEKFNINKWRNLWKGISLIVDLEKPAHTYYDIDARVPGIVVGKRSTVAEDTLIWEKSYYKLLARETGIVVGQRATIGQDTIISKDRLTWKDIYIWND